MDIAARSSVTNDLGELGRKIGRFLRSPTTRLRVLARRFHGRRRGLPHDGHSRGRCWGCGPSLPTGNKRRRARPQSPLPPAVPCVGFIRLRRHCRKPPVSRFRQQLCRFVADAQHSAMIVKPRWTPATLSQEKPLTGSCRWRRFSGETCSRSIAGRGVFADSFIAGKTSM